MKHLLTILALVLALPAAAATVEERSPFRQGHWWDPTRSGHGFEILSNTTGDVFVVWYTYDRAGDPTWYTAQGSRDNLGGSWPLLKHTWADGRIAASTAVGSLRLSQSHFEKLSATWTVDGAQGTWSLEPFVQSGTINEVDLSGHWYSPSNSGWGMTLVDQGDVFGAVIYAYTPSGMPTWVAGFDRGKGTHVDLYRTRGACPSCAPSPATLTAAGGIDISHSGDVAVTIRGAPSIQFAEGVRIDGARISQLGRPASTRRADYQLASFARPETLKGFIAAGMGNRVYASLGSDFSPAPPGAAAVSFSTTNTQEAGVDEADVVKTDGRYVYALTPTVYNYVPGVNGQPGVSTVTRDVRIAWVGDGAGLEPVGRFSVAAGQGYMAEAGLFLHANNLVTLASGYYYGGWYYSPQVTSETTVEILDLSSPARPISRWRAKLSGAMVSSRRIGDRLYVVTRFTPNLPGYAAYAPTEAVREANRALLEAAPLSALLPSIATNGADAVAAVRPESVYAPQLGGSRAVADMVVVTSIDIREARVVDTIAIAGRTEAMYVSDSNLYLASTRYETHFTSTLPRPIQASLLNSDIHQIAIGGDKLRVVGTGSVEGTVGWGDKAAFRFGEYAGRLGIVTSNTSGWWGDNSNRVTLLQPSTVASGLLKTLSYLPNARRPAKIGKPNELLYGTRFVGDKLYAVTFKKTDPLYAIDLSDPTDPRITGELEIPGFSDYLHPLPGGLLLGFGKDSVPADTSGDAQWAWFQGLQLTLFDVTGAAPRELRRVLIGKRGSDSSLMYSHHAFSALPRADGSTLIAFPASVAEGTPVYGSGPTTVYSWQYSGLLHFEVRGTSPADASLTQARTLVSSRANGPISYGPPGGDGYYDPGRSVLFPDASIYVSGGKFWRQDASGNTTGPY